MPDPAPARERIARLLERVHLAYVEGADLEWVRALTEQQADALLAASPAPAAVEGALKKWYADRSISLTREQYAELTRTVTTLVATGRERERALEAFLRDQSYHPPIQGRECPHCCALLAPAPPAAGA